MRRFHTQPECITASTITFTGPEAKHICQVLRLKLGELIEVFDGSGTIYLTQLTSMDKNKVEAQILNHLDAPRPTHPLYVAQSLLKGKKMDFLYQKLTELSVEGLYPFVSQFSEEKPRQAKQNERWQRISLEACKQSKRPTTMECFPVSSFNDLLESCSIYKTKIVFWENEDENFLSSFPEIFRSGSPTIIMLGPEGGFSSSEVDAARAKGFTSLSLGPRILRAETAAVAATSIIQFMMGNLSSRAVIDWERSS
nr:16S rRNA (uracil(1498)-N(3))-methyltransferase [Desulfobulbaceae bacterium]